MPIELTKEEVADVIPSLRKYLKEELELDISEMRAKFLLNYFLKGAELVGRCGPHRRSHLPPRL